MKNKPYYKITSIYQDGSEDTPTLYKLDERSRNWLPYINRRVFLRNAGILLGAAISLPLLSAFSNIESITDNEFDDCSDILAHNGKISKLCFSPDSKKLVSVGMTNIAKVWDFPAGIISKTFPINLSDFKDCAFCKDNSFFSVYFNSSVKIYNTKEFKIKNNISLDNYISGNYSNTLNRLVVKNKQGKFLIYDTDTGLVIDTIDSFISNQSNVLSISSSGQYVAIGHPNEVIIYKTPFNFYQTQNMIINEKGRFIISLLDNQTYKIWELPIGEIIKTIKIDFDYSLISISSDGAYIAFGYNDMITILQVSNNDKIILDNDKKLTCFAFSPDTKYFASASETGAVKIWSIPDFSHLTCLFDKSILSVNKKVNQYTSTNAYGQTITFTLPCGSPIPEGAVCVCNCVPGAACSCVGRSHCSCVGQSNRICTCDKICTCIPVK